MSSATEVPDDSVVDTLLAALDRAKVTEAGDYIGLLQRTVRDNLWARRSDAQGNFFASFADFVVHPRPRGLGAVSEQDVDLVKHALRANEFVVAVAELLDKITRCPGRPSENQTNGGGFQPFYPATGGPNSRDRALRQLQSKRPDLLQDIADGKLSVNRAAIEAGIRDDPDTRLVDELSKRTAQLPPESLLEVLRRLAPLLSPSERQAAAEIFRVDEAHGFAA
jgi:hypothetical protein